jgi:hypothetical protein
MTFNLSRMRSAAPSWKDSAQSPAWSKARPCAIRRLILGQFAGLTGEDERRLTGEALFHVGQRGQVGPTGFRAATWARRGSAPTGTTVTT